MKIFPQLTILILVLGLLVTGCTTYEVPVEPADEEQVDVQPSQDDSTVSITVDEECNFNFECKDGQTCEDGKCVGEVMEKEESESEEVTEETTEEEVEETVQPTADNPDLYILVEGDMVDIMGKSVMPTLIQQPAFLDLEVDGVKGTITNTQSEEIVNGLRVTVELFDFKSDGVNNKVHVTLKELELASNEYLLEKGIRQLVNGKEIVLDKSQDTGWITVTVYDVGTIQGIQDKVRPEDSKKINGITVTNVENYYENTQYAIVSIDS